MNRHGDAEKERRGDKSSAIAVSASPRLPISTSILDRQPEVNHLENQIAKIARRQHALRVAVKMQAVFAGRDRQGLRKRDRLFAGLQLRIQQRAVDAQGRVILSGECGFDLDLSWA